MTVSRFRIAGMECAAEEQLVRMAVADLEGVDGVAVDLTVREVAVEHTPDPTVVGAALQSPDLGTTHLGDEGEATVAGDGRRERPALMIALVINAGFFVGELTIGLISRSMGVVADALDMGADASVYALSLLAVGAVTARKKRLARASGYLQFGLAVRQRVRTGEAHLEASWIFTANDIKVNALVIMAAIVANGARRILRISR